MLYCIYRASVKPSHARLLDLLRSCSKLRAGIEQEETEFLEMKVTAGISRLILPGANL
jgi:hypothetical protein